MSLEKPSLHTLIKDALMATGITILFAVAIHLVPLDGIWLISPLASLYRSDGIAIEGAMLLATIPAVTMLFQAVRGAVPASRRIRTIRRDDVVRWLTGPRLVISSFVVTAVLFGMAYMIKSLVILEWLRQATSSFLGQSFVDWRSNNMLLWSLILGGAAWLVLVITIRWLRSRSEPRTKLHGQSGFKNSL